MSTLIFDLLSIFVTVQVRFWVADRLTIPDMIQPLLPAFNDRHGKEENNQSSKHSKEQYLPTVDNLIMEHPDLGPSAFDKLKRGWNMDQYTFVRLSNLQSSDSAQMFSTIRDLKGVFTLVELPDESWEIVTSVADIPILENKLSQIFPGCNLDSKYDPIEPNSADVERLCLEAGSSSFPTPSETANPFYLKARDLKMGLFRKTIQVLSTTHPKIAIFYACWYERTWQSEYGTYV
ncbi:hypothetical protein UCRPC4_g06905 [Phaeomoniella chlamydospora]|uniref:Uncharacterized protein n=1 Tax=Phaeomoniella chlamydospora TaxID=158046 RepID=A0A0G2DT85_PHACM|nr:hypothetical protein UCRPC4_g06905 [Phaeomoniella chlamydospora]